MADRREEKGASSAPRRRRRADSAKATEKANETKQMPATLEALPDVLAETSTRTVPIPSQIASLVPEEELEEIAFSDGEGEIAGGAVNGEGGGQKGS